jgi:hypothetical protein
MVSVRTTCREGELDDQIALIAFRDLRAVARMYPAGNKFTLFNVPVRLPVRLLAIGLRGGQL